MNDYRKPCFDHISENKIFPVQYNTESPQKKLSIDMIKSFFCAFVYFNFIKVWG